MIDTTEILIRPAVSVIVCAFTEDRWDDICQVIGSLRTQTEAPGEIILVIDHCPPLLRRARQTFRDVTVVPNHFQKGLAGGRNTGVAHAWGDVVAFIDDDAAAEPDWLTRLADHYLDPTVLGVGGLVEPAWEHGRPGWFPPELDWVVGCSYQGMRSELGPVRNFIGANMSFRREILAEIGGFSIELGRVDSNPFGCEETELCLRVSQRYPDAILLYEPAAAVSHRVRKQRARWRYLRSRCYAEGRSKATVAGLAGADSALASERSYVRSAIPRGVARSLLKALLGRPSGLLAAFALVMAVFTTGFGYSVGRWSGRKGTGELPVAEEPEAEVLDAEAWVLESDRAVPDEQIWVLDPEDWLPDIDDWAPGSGPPVPDGGTPAEVAAPGTAQPGTAQPGPGDGAADRVAPQTAGDGAGHPAPRAGRGTLNGHGNTLAAGYGMRVAVPQAPPAGPEPAAEPEAPAAEPVAPAAEPVAPAAGPVAPAAGPVAPAAGPVAPAENPEASPASPQAPVTGPQMVQAGSVAPVAEPEARPAAPEAPVARPEAVQAAPEAPPIVPGVPAPRQEAPATAPEIVEAGTPPAPPQAPAFGPEAPPAHAPPAIAPEAAATEPEALPIAPQVAQAQAPPAPPQAPAPVAPEAAAAGPVAPPAVPQQAQAAPPVAPEAAATEPVALPIAPQVFGAQAPSVPPEAPPAAPGAPPARPAAPPAVPQEAGAPPAVAPEAAATEATALPIAPQALRAQAPPAPPEAPPAPPEVVVPPAAPEVPAAGHAPPEALVPEALVPEAPAPGTLAPAAPAAEPGALPGDRDRLDIAWWEEPPAPAEPSRARRTPLRTKLRTTAGTRGQLAGQLLPWAGLAAVAGLWVYALSRVEVGVVPTAGLGLISALPVTFWVAAALLMVSFGWTVVRWPGRWPVLGAHLVTLVVILHATPAIVYGTLRYSWAWKHVGVVDYIIHHGIDFHLGGVLGVYQGWPGFFALNAFLTNGGGLHSALTYASWALAANDLLWLGPVLLIARAFTADWRMIWTTAWVFELGNWVGQDYFSPQAFAYFLFLTVIAICLRWLGDGRPRPRWIRAGLAGVARWVRRHAPRWAADRLPARRAGGGHGSPRRAGRRAPARWLSGRTLPRRARDRVWWEQAAEGSLWYRVAGHARPDQPEATLPPEGADVSRSARLVLVAALVPLIAAIASSHQLTPIMVVIALTVLAVFRHLRPRFLLPLLALAITVGWIFYGGLPWLNANNNQVFAGFGSLWANSSSHIVGGAQVPPDQIIVEWGARLLSAAIGVMALAGFWRYRRHRGKADRRSWNRIALLGVAAIPMVAGNSYGGEIIFRAFLFALPFMAVAGAALFFPRPWSPRRWLAGTALVVTTVLLAAGFFVSNYGTDAMNYFTPQEVTASQWLYRTAPAGAQVISVNSGFPWAFVHYNLYSYTYLDGVDLSSAVLRNPVQTVTTLMSPPHPRVSYLVLTRSQAEQEAIGGPWSPSQVPRVFNALLGSGNFKTVYLANGVTILRLARAPVQAASPGKHPAPRPRGHLAHHHRAVLHRHQAARHPHRNRALLRALRKRYARHHPVTIGGRAP